MFAGLKDALMHMIVNRPARKAGGSGNAGLGPALAMQFQNALMVLGELCLRVHADKTKIFARMSPVFRIFFFPWKIAESRTVAKGILGPALAIVVS